MDEQQVTKAQNIDASEFEEKVLNSDKPVLVDFWAEWCMPCKMMAPVLDQIAEDMKDKLHVMKINTESPENQQLAMKYDIRSIPNMKLFKDGQVIKDFVGFKPKESFIVELAQTLGENS